ncbi:MAG: ABC transporter ATP-binding protein [Campylobacterota bacterium]
MTKHYSLNTLLHYITAQKRELWLTNLYGVLATLFFLPIPILIPLLIDEVLLENPGKLTEYTDLLFGQQEVWFYLAITLLSVIFLRLLVFVLTNAKTFHATTLTEKINYHLRQNILYHLQHVSIAEYETLKSGGVASKTVQDVEAVSDFANMLVITLLTAALTVIGVAVIMMWMHWVLALLVFTLNPFFLAFSRIIGKKMGELFRRQNEAYELYNEALNEVLELFTQVRASNQEQTLFGFLKQKAKAIESASVDYGYRASVAHGSSALLTTTVVDIFRVLGIAAVAYSDLTIGMMLAFLFYLSTLVSPVQQLMGLVITYQSTKPAFARINALLSLEQEPHYPHVADPFTGVQSTSVELKNITFGYSDKSPVLKDVSLRAEAGQKVALVGPSGSGKTTIAQLMVGFYLPQSGDISYGNSSVTQIGLPVIRENVALMLQDALFFNDTVRMNLTLSSDRSDEAIYSALEAAQLKDFVDTLEDGLDTKIGKNGIRLSGGQRQRLAIARLILSDPKVIIFDESTSALDGRTEHDLYETLADFLKDKTTIIIAHRTTTIKQADYVYLIENGKVKDEGTYDALNAKGRIKEDFDVA